MSPEIIALLYGNAQVPLALSDKCKAALTFFESVVPNHNVVCTHSKGDRPTVQSLRSPFIQLNGDFHYDLWNTDTATS